MTEKPRTKRVNRRELQKHMEEQRTIDEQRQKQMSQQLSDALDPPMTADQLRNTIVVLLDSLEGCHVLAVQAAIQSLSENDTYRLSVFTESVAMFAKETGYVAD